MSSMSKVTIKKGEAKFQWSQTAENVVVSIPIKNVTMKNINIFYSDLCLKVTAQTIKFFTIIDFAHEVDYLHQKNRAQLLDDRLEIFLMKQEVGKMWDSLELDSSTVTRQEAIDRRNLSIDRFNQMEKKMKEDAK